MHKDFDIWNQTKKEIQQDARRPLFKERDVWWCRLGVNVGDEEDGKGEFFNRPVLVLKKFNKRVFIAVPLSSKIKEDSHFYFKFTFQHKEQSVILPQIKLTDSKRLSDKMGSISKKEFEIIKGKVKSLIFRFTQPPFRGCGG
ncbi:MAG: type II toxin-antitoxin system PemK/MazF family toxin [Rickettsiales bacterium]|nr:type II toxin-antitoxin system PemK/MazF family toxin [Pseudomonadota bacterium]MDA0966743.1 type II toxin-antitoxin system PemK/MazF family toxin [Pseudomonadota bacterium]MDG4543415.1 type II toxin-antitoxin system PemK/MazF family toxin [Rickettsiales bacterium]MDG4546191.1 type II toxin-antitoxin system PemK/MazF family toxin [Rickettsiales bacterium]MDG4547664.1 type II toxin-antitoxin system PemK/MazF family toxin [Rickettsiales bacterium]